MKKGPNSITNNYDSIFLETPIDNINEDIFGIMPYAEQLEFSLKKGARFVAIDGKHGSGKSSLINLTRNLIKSNQNKRGIKKEKNYFVNVNFLNINESNIQNSEIKNSEEMTEELSNSSKINNVDIINRYHRYFVNQVANDLYKNPYNVEKLFYNNYISYSTVSLRGNKLFKIIVDKILLILVSFVSLYLLYSGIFKSFIDFGEIYAISTKIFPYVLFAMFVLVILYGYGFYKPTKDMNSPMLEIDKCRNNLCKVLFNVIPKNSNVYFIIDDLDRIDENLQLPIISLLYNEYYPLNEIINGIKLKFIFMIDINKLNSNDKEINANKLFDYVINVSNNQIIILRNYIEKIIDNNKTLKEIFEDVSSKDYIIGLILNNYPTIREIKHLFNRIIAKYKYLKCQNYNEINKGELLIISLLIGLEDIDNLNNIINTIINDSTKKIDDNYISNIVKEACNKKIIDNNFYIYLYNFIDVDNLLNSNEQYIYNIANNIIFSKEDEWLKIYEIMSSRKISFSKLYNEIYKYLSNNAKILLLGDLHFCNFVKTNYSVGDIILKDIYKNTFIHLCFSKIWNSNYFFFLGEETETLDNYYNDFMSKEDGEDLKEKEDYVKELKEFIKNMRSNIKYFDMSKYLNCLKVEQDLFDLIYSQTLDGIPVIYEMILDNKLDWKTIRSFINDDIIAEVLNLADEGLRINVEKSILNDEFSFEIMVDIIYKEKNKIDNIDVILDKINSYGENYISLEKLIKIIEKYGYKTILDKHIIFNLNSNTRKVIDFLNKNEFNLSKQILDKLNNIKNVYSYNDYYNNLFIKEHYYKLYIYSKAIETKIFKVENKLKNKQEYLDSLVKVYINMGNESFDGYQFTNGFSKVIIERLEPNNIVYNKNNFWKILKLIPLINNYSIAVNYFNRVKELNVLTDFCNYCYYNCDNYEFIKLLSLYVSEFGQRHNKSIITRAKNKLEQKTI